jgi:hypothetical protein
MDRREVKSQFTHTRDFQPNLQTNLQLSNLQLTVEIPSRQLQAVDRDNNKVKNTATLIVPTPEYSN